MTLPLNAPGAASSPHGAVIKRTSAKKRNVAKARASSPSGVGHAEAQALAAQPLNPAEAQRPALALAPVRRSPNESTQLGLTCRRSPELPARP
jgi:hypothetical protein